MSDSPQPYLPPIYGKNICMQNKSRAEILVVLAKDLKTGDKILSVVVEDKENGWSCRISSLGADSEHEILEILGKSYFAYSTKLNYKGLG